MVRLMTYGPTGEVLLDSTAQTLGLIKSASPQPVYDWQGLDLLVRFGLGYAEHETNFLSYRGNNNYQDPYDIQDYLGVGGHREQLYSHFTKGFFRQREIVVRTLNKEVDVQAVDDNLRFVYKDDYRNIQPTGLAGLLNKALDAEFFGAKDLPHKQRRSAMQEYLNTKLNEHWHTRMDNPCVYYIDVVNDTCPIAFIGCIKSIHKNAGLAWSKEGNLPLLRFSHVKKQQTGEWRFYFESSLLLSRDELASYRVYFFDVFKHKETQVGLNLYNQTGKITFSTAQPPLQCVYVPKPKFKTGVQQAINPIGWQKNTLGDVSHYPLDTQRYYATQCVWGYKTGLFMQGIGMGNGLYATISSTGLKGGVCVFAMPTSASNYQRGTIRQQITKIGYNHPEQTTPYLSIYQTGFAVADVTNLPFPYQLTTA